VENPVLSKPVTFEHQQESLATGARDTGSFSTWFTWARSKTYEGDTRKAVELYQTAAEIRPEDYQSVLLRQEHSSTRPGSPKDLIAGSRCYPESSEKFT